MEEQAQLWTLVCGALVFFMQAGFTCYEAGLVRSKNVISVSIENLLTLMITVVMFTFLGFPLMYGETVFTASPGRYAFLFLQIMFAAVAVTIFAGAMSERSRLTALLVASVVTAGLIYPVFGRWVWGTGGGFGSSWLGRLGYLDYAGATVIHSTAGFVTLAGLMVVGGRKEKMSGKSNIPLATLGVFILWFGWLGFNGGSQNVSFNQLGRVFLNTTLAASFGMMGALVTNLLIRRKGRYLISIFNGVLGGLVAITAMSGYCRPWAAIAAGFLAGAAADFSTVLLDKYQIDDVVNAIPAHLVGGVTGALLLPFLIEPQYLACGSRIEQFGAQTAGVAVNFAWSFGLALVMFRLIDRVMGIRVSEKDEKMGLNIVEFNDLYSWESYMEISSYEEQINEKNRLLMKEAQMLTRTEAEEKQKLARELHDGLGQSLAALRLVLLMGRNDTSGQALELVDSSIAEMRGVLNDLRPAWLEQGLEKALAYMAESLNRLDGFSCRLVVERSVPPFDETVSLNIYRMVQEALTNVVKHSKAASAVVTCGVGADGGDYRITVSDDGIGFDDRAVDHGLGIASIADRARMIGGTSRVVSAPGRGTTVEIRIPVSHG